MYPSLFLNELFYISFYVTFFLDFLQLYKLSIIANIIDTRNAYDLQR